MHKKAALGAISFYQRKISPLFPARCRYYPTCSQYTYDAIERYGFFLGTLLGALRLLRCNPLFPGGVDPVPDLKFKYKKNTEAVSGKNGEETDESVRPGGSS